MVAPATLSFVPACVRTRVDIEAARADDEADEKRASDDRQEQNGQRSLQGFAGEKGGVRDHDGESSAAHVMPSLWGAARPLYPVRMTSRFANRRFVRASKSYTR